MAVISTLLLLLGWIGATAAEQQRRLVTPKPIGANFEYMESLAAAGLISRAPRTRHSSERPARFVEAGPPPPGVNFTTPDGSLIVGLRNTTRAVQVRETGLPSSVRGGEALKCKHSSSRAREEPCGAANASASPRPSAPQLLSPADDDRWFRNFSFVPPLWSAAPAKPHRDGPGCNHIGDVTLRVQPASETNASSWAFYSSSLGADVVPAVPLPHGGSPAYDAVNLTDAVTAPGQIDTRYPLGLHVFRSVEPAPGVHTVSLPCQAGRGRATPPWPPRGALC
jgi:hypothetical protein